MGLKTLPARTAATLALAAAGLATPAALAVVSPANPIYDRPAPAIRAADLPAGTTTATYVGTTDAIHSGGGTAEDTLLALNVATELANDPRLVGATVTIAANRGDVMLSGTAESPEQGAYAEQAARRVAGVTRVSGTLSPQGG